MVPLQTTSCEVVLCDREVSKLFWHRALQPSVEHQRSFSPRCIRPPKMCGRQRRPTSDYRSGVDWTSLQTIRPVHSSIQNRPRTNMNTRSEHTPHVSRLQTPEPEVKDEHTEPRTERPPPIPCHGVHKTHRGPNQTHGHTHSNYPPTLPLPLPRPSPEQQVGHHTIGFAVWSSEPVFLTQSKNQT